MNQKPDIANIDPETWNFQVRINGYDEKGYYANRDRRIAYGRKYYAEHRQGRREAAKRRREKQRKENCK